MINIIIGVILGVAFTLIFTRAFWVAAVEKYEDADERTASADKALREAKRMIDIGRDERARTLKSCRSILQVVRKMVDIVAKKDKVLAEWILEQLPQLREDML